MRQFTPATAGRLSPDRGVGADHGGWRGNAVVRRATVRRIWGSIRADGANGIAASAA